MINQIVSTLFSMIFKVLAFIGNIILAPITLLINGMFPDMSSYIDNLENFFNDYVFRGIAFMRESFINLTHFPRALLSLGVAFILGVWGFRLATHAIKFILNLWSLFRKGGING